METVELLSPAGDRERLDMVLHYGADAVYLAREMFGLRAAAGNFTLPELRSAVEDCHKRNVSVYLTVNAIPHQDDISALPRFLAESAETGVDALIITDLGVLRLAKKYAPNVPIHISTQFGVMNSETACMLYELGARRVILAREMSMQDIAELRKNIPDDLQIEVFVHGAMCVSFSGRCLLSNYLTGRDGNGGACAQPCRWKYHLVEETRPGEYFEITEDGGTHIMNSADLCMIEHLAELREAGVSSVKIEGRMKSAYYAAMVTNAYRHALDDVLARRDFNPIWRRECDMISHRKYSTGFFFGEPKQYYPDSMYFSEADVCAVVESCEGCEARLTQRNRFSVGDTLELVNRSGVPVAFRVDDLRDGENAPVSCANHPMMPLLMQLPVPAEPLSVLRRVRRAENQQSGD